MIQPKKIASFKHIIECYNTDKQNDYCLLTKLTKYHI